MAEGEAFRVFLRNGNPGAPGAGKSVQLNIRQDSDFKKFLKLAGKKLKIKAAKVYVSTGNRFTEVTALDEIQLDQEVFITSGGPPNGTAQREEQETLFLSVLGAGGVGKSALTLRFVRDFFVRDWDPTIEDAYRKTIDVDNKVCTLDILDTAGQDEFESLRAQWMMDKNGYILVYNLNSKQTLEDLKPFFKLYKQMHESRAHEKHVPIILVGNKKDVVDVNPKKREVTENEGKECARLNNAIYIEASAATGENVAEVFETFVREVRKFNAPASKDKTKKCVIL